MMDGDRGFVGPSAPTRRRVLAVALTSSLTLTPAGAFAQAAGEVRGPILELYAALEPIMRAGQDTPFQQRFNMLAPVVDKVFDLDTILRVSVGLRWSALDEPSRERLAHAFRRFTIASYVANFDSSDGERFEVSPDTRASGVDRIVMSHLVLETKERIKLDYLMRRGAAGWRIVDVLLDGTISRVAVQRSDFRVLLGKGDAGALVASLNRKTADLSGGALGG
jgi:phospholipid transport system substrate-binding protein